MRQYVKVSGATTTTVVVLYPVNHNP